MLIIVFGLPGSGKTFFASALSRALPCRHVNTDIVRKNTNSPIDYSPKGREEIYDKILELTEQILTNKENLIVDGTFVKKIVREKFKRKAQQLKTPVHYVEIKADEKTIQERVSLKRAYSDADFEIYRKLKMELEPMEETHLILWSDKMTLEEMVEEARNFLKLGK